jgi:DnaJ-class molecular chaperone
MSKDYYKLLEVSKTASPEEIQKSYRRLARKYHPDLNPDDKSAQQKFKDIQHAYDVLNDPEKRRMYDQMGPDFERMGPGGPFPGGGAGGFEQMFGGGGGGGGGAGPGGFGFGSIDELFQQFAGGGRGGGGGGRAGGKRGGGSRGPSKGADLRVQLTVPFNTAVLGGSASISVQRGNKEESIQVRIPSGVLPGTKMRLREQGNSGEGGGPNGDLIVELDVAPHPFFQRNGFNLELRLPISLKEALLGATIDIPTPSGTVALKVPPGSSAGKKLRVKAQGVHDSKGNVGDLYVELQIKLPTKLREVEQTPQVLKDAAEAVEKMYDEPLRGDLRW